MTATGTIFEGYRLMRPLGRGWLGEVYTAQNLDGAAVGALRILAPELTAQPQVMTQFRRLHQKWRQLSHPGILGVSDLLERDQRVYYGMNLAQNGSARQLLQAQAQNGQFLDLLVVVDIARQVAAALAYAHDVNLMHGDLKPENLLLSPARALLGRPAYGVLVSDFGVGELQAFTHGVHDRLIVTTPAYMSPEQCRGIRTEVRSDIYTLGVVLYELLTNMVPFETRDLADAVQKHQHVAPIPPGQIRVDIPQDLEEIVLTCLAKAPDYRYRSAHDLEDALQRVLSGLLPQGPRPTMVLPDLPEPPAPRIEPLRDRTPFPRIQVVGEDGQTIRVEPLQAQTATLGRAAGNTIVLEHAGVSRHHLSVEVEDAGVFVTDLASTNGSTLGGVALVPRERTAWPDGGVMRVEPFWLRLQPPQKVVQQARIGVQVEDNDVSLTPGELTVLKVSLANTGRTVDHFQLGVEGVPPEWVQNLYNELQLNPGMTAQATLRVMVPRSSQALSASYPVKVVARSRENPAEFGYAPMNWLVLPFTETRIELTPRRRSAWRRTHYDLKMINTSNVPVTYNPTIRDEEGQVHLQSPTDMIRVPQNGDLRNIIPVRTIIHNTWMRLREGVGKVNIGAMPQNVQVLPGAEYEHRIQVRLPFRWIATPRQRILRLHPHPDSGPDHPENLSLLHLPLIPLWLLPIVLVFGVLLALWLLQAPSIVTVSVIPVETQPQAINAQQAGDGQTQAGQTQSESAQASQQPRTGQPFYLDFETRNATRIVVKPWNKTLYKGTGRLLIPEGVRGPVNAQVIVYGRIKTTQQALTITPRLPTPVIKLFSVSPENISSGQSATLRWDVSNVSEITIEPLGTLPPKGESQQKVSTDTSFHLIAKGDDNKTTEKTLNVRVLPASIDLFTITPARAKLGDVVTLRWKVRNAGSVSLDPLGTVQAQDSAKYTMQADQTFVLRAQVGDQAIVKIITVKLVTPSVQSFTVTPPDAKVGDTVTVSWNVKDATGVSIDPFGTVPASGQRQVVVSGATNFRLTASNGQASTELGSLTITPGAKPVSVTSFTANPRKPRTGDPVTLEWQSENAQSAELSGLPGQGTLALPASGSTIITAPADTSSLTLTAKSADGSTSSQSLALPVLPKAVSATSTGTAQTGSAQTGGSQGAGNPGAGQSGGRQTATGSGAGGTGATAGSGGTTVEVVPTVLPPVIRFTSTASQVKSGQSVTLSWNVSNAPRVKLFPGGKVFGPTGKLVLKPTRSQTFTLLAGSVKAQTTVQVVGTPQAPKTSSQQSSVKPPVAPANPPPVDPPLGGTGGTTPAAPIITSFTVTPTQAKPGDTVRLRWETSGAKRVVIGGLNLRSQPAKGEATQVIQQTTTYVLQAINGPQISRKLQSVRVTNAGSTGGTRSGAFSGVIGGAWLHPFGDLSLVVQGSSVTGTFTNIRTGERGAVKGTVSTVSSGYSLNAQVVSTGITVQQGDGFVVTFNPDTKTFSGTYTNRGATQRWCGWRPGASPISCVSGAANLDTGAPAVPPSGLQDQP
ncbi:protein kinase domain-containing protein [Deinococcus altitudinis]|uniref:protein kinase domain-containing protein n=1 Tax=Deinococcus altitudinis TaxID=468914 RepID=UPI0038922556